MPPVADWWPLTIKFPLYAKFELIILVNQSFQPMKNQSCHIDNVIKLLLLMVKFKIHILTFLFFCFLSLHAFGTKNAIFKQSRLELHCIERTQEYKKHVSLENRMILWHISMLSVLFPCFPHYFFKFPYFFPIFSKFHNFSIFFSNFHNFP